jgi:hypothetical protein
MTARTARINTYAGGATIARRIDLAKDALRNAGRQSIQQAIRTCAAIYGTIPPDLIDWLREQFRQGFNAHAAARAVALAEDRMAQQFRMPTSRLDREFSGIASSLIRDLEIELGPLELRGRLAAVAGGQLPSIAPGVRDVDAFISHAGEDKPAVGRPLAEGLIVRGFSVWLDEYELTVGRSVYTAIDKGLRTWRFGVVILSRNFFAKTWPQNELHALAALGASEGRNKILPVWYGVEHKDVARFSPLLADVFAAKMSDGLNTVLDQIAAALKTEGTR